jgi:nitrogen fixation/metabolism regulation signal transduction histidine kinase
VSQWVRAWHRYRRQNRFLIGLFLFVLGLSVIGVYLAQRTQVESPQDLTNRLLLYILWHLDISLILILLFILARNLFRLAVERRSGVLGSRFRTKLVLTYVVLTFVPVIFMFLIATNLLQRSIERWFSAPVEMVLRSGNSVTYQVREMVEQRLAHQARQAAEELGRYRSPEQRLARLHAIMGTDLLALYEGENLVQALTDPRSIPQSLPSLQWDKIGPSGHQADRWRGGLLVRAWHPVSARYSVVVGDMLPRELSSEMKSAAAAYATFQEDKLARGTVASTTILVFLAITLLLLFTTVWVGLYLSRRFTEPLLAVVAATQRVAEGSELEEVASPATDEVAVLVDSFNAMVRRVRSTEQEILTSNQELATLLATIPTGVLSISADRKQFRPNPAAARLLGEPGWAGVWQAMEVLDAAGVKLFYQRLIGHAPTGAGTQLTIEVGGTLRHVDVTHKDLPGGGQVVAIDDLTQLISAQRQAAWSEVARHIAHEIMNPLTPIRLAAERIQRRGRKLDGEIREVITSGTEAIIAHVSGLKELVDSFHQYARMPAVNPKPTLVSRIMREATSLYEGVKYGLGIDLQLSPDRISAMVDPVLLRQALVNLLDNAVEAIEDGGTRGASARAEGSDLILEVTDTGIGLPTEDTGKLVQPFFSTKGRGSGMGLGLVHRIVTDHGGTLEITSRTPRGTRVRLSFPGAVIAEETPLNDE